MICTCCISRELYLKLLSGSSLYSERELVQYNNSNNQLTHKLDGQKSVVGTSHTHNTFLKYSSHVECLDAREIRNYSTTPGLRPASREKGSLSFFFWVSRRCKSRANFSVIYMHTIMELEPVEMRLGSSTVRKTISRAFVSLAEHAFLCGVAVVETI
jgi:hypothetical protein